MSRDSPDHELRSSSFVGSPHGFSSSNSRQSTQLQNFENIQSPPPTATSPHEGFENAVVFDTLANIPLAVITSHFGDPIPVVSSQSSASNSRLQTFDPSIRAGFSEGTFENTSQHISNLSAEEVNEHTNTTFDTTGMSTSSMSNSRSQNAQPSVSVLATFSPASSSRIPLPPYIPDEMSGEQGQNYPQFSQHQHQQHHVHGSMYDPSSPLSSTSSRPSSPILKPPPNLPGLYIANTASSPTHSTYSAYSSQPSQQQQSIHQVPNQPSLATTEEQSTQQQYSYTYMPSGLSYAAAAAFSTAPASSEPVFSQTLDYSMARDQQQPRQNQFQPNIQVAHGSPASSHGSRDHEYVSNNFLAPTFSTLPNSQPNRSDASQQMETTNLIGDFSRSGTYLNENATSYSHTQLHTSSLQSSPSLQSPQDSSQQEQQQQQQHALQLKPSQQQQANDSPSSPNPNPNTNTNSTNTYANVNPTVYNNLQMSQYPTHPHGHAMLHLQPVPIQGLFDSSSVPSTPMSGSSHSTLMANFQPGGGPRASMGTGGSMIMTGGLHQPAYTFSQNFAHSMTSTSGLFSNTHKNVLPLSGTSSCSSTPGQNQNQQHFMFSGQTGVSVPATPANAITSNFSIEGNGVGTGMGHGLLSESMPMGVSGVSITPGSIPGQGDNGKTKAKGVEMGMGMASIIPEGETEAEGESDEEFLQQRQQKQHQQKQDLQLTSAQVQPQSQIQTPVITEDVTSSKVENPKIEDSLHTPSIPTSTNTSTVTPTVTDTSAASTTAPPTTTTATSKSSSKAPPQHQRIRALLNSITFTKAPYVPKTQYSLADLLAGRVFETPVELRSPPKFIPQTPSTPKVSTPTTTVSPEDPIDGSLASPITSVTSVVAESTGAISTTTSKTSKSDYDLEGENGIDVNDPGNNTKVKTKIKTKENEREGDEDERGTTKDGKAANTSVSPRKAYTLGSDYSSFIANVFSFIPPRELALAPCHVSRHFYASVTEGMKRSPVLSLEGLWALLNHRHVPDTLALARKYQSCSEVRFAFCNIITDNFVLDFMKKVFPTGSSRLRLSAVSFYYCYRLTDDFMIYFLGMFPHIRRLDLGLCYKFTDEILEVLAKVPMLEELSLRGNFKYTSGRIHELLLVSPQESFPMLKMLDVTDCCSQICPPEIIVQLAELRPNLTILCTTYKKKCDKIAIPE